MVPSEPEIRCGSFWMIKLVDGGDQEARQPAIEGLVHGHDRQRLSASEHAMAVGAGDTQVDRIGDGPGTRGVREPVCPIRFGVAALPTEHTLESRRRRSASWNAASPR